MSLKRFLKSAFIGIAVALIVLVIGVAGQVAWVVWTSPGIHQTSASVPVARTATSVTDRSETVSESYTDFTWTPVHWASPLIFALAGLVAGFSWAYRRNAVPMRIYLKSLLVGLCAAAVVLGVCWSAGLVRHALHASPPSSHQTPAAPSDEGFTVQTLQDIVVVDVTTPPWYITALAGLALVSASGWQLRRSRRLRR